MKDVLQTRYQAKPLVVATLCCLLSLSQYNGLYDSEEVDPALDDGRRKYKSFNLLCFRVLTAAVESTTIVCYIILITVSNAVVKYLALIVAVSCAGSAYPVIWPERIRALDGTVAAGIGIGVTNAMAQFGGIVGPHVYSTVFGPGYHTSYIICLCFLIVAIIAILLSWLLVWRKDRRIAAFARDRQTF